MLQDGIHGQRLNLLDSNQMVSLCSNLVEETCADKVKRTCWLSEHGYV